MVSDSNEIDHGTRKDESDILRYATNYHVPVLWHTVVKDLITSLDGVYVDCTLGGGGHTAAILDNLGEDGRVVGIDRDQDALQEVALRLERDVSSGRLVLVHGAFGDLDDHLEKLDLRQVDGVLMDLGVSSHQIDKPERGFSYASEGTLDMRMNPRSGSSAYDMVNSLDERSLAQVFFDFGEEAGSRRIARAIVAARPLETTKDLAEAVRSVVPAREETKTLSRIFQALRIAVNAELDELERALLATMDRVKRGGRVVVISYHSLEDRRVKRFFRTGNFEGRLDRDVYGNPMVGWRELYRKPVEAGAHERAANPRSRSARLRAAERIATKDHDY